LKADIWTKIISAAASFEAPVVVIVCNPGLLAGPVSTMFASDLTELTAAAVEKAAMLGAAEERLACLHTTCLQCLNNIHASC